MQVIKQFIATFRHKRFKRGITREIYLKIFPHLTDHEDHGYPFSDDAGLIKAWQDGAINIRDMVVKIDQAARKMPSGEAESFRYIVTRDINERMAKYLEYAKTRECPVECDLQFAAQAA